MTPRLSSTYTGDQPALLWWISSPSKPSILGMLGPQMSMSRSPTCQGEQVLAVGPMCKIRQRRCDACQVVQCSCMRHCLGTMKRSHMSLLLQYAALHCSMQVCPGMAPKCNSNHACYRSDRTMCVTDQESAPLCFWQQVQRQAVLRMCFSQRLLSLIRPVSYV